MFCGIHLLFRWKLPVIIILISVFGNTLTSGQSGNPFDIKSRLKEEPSQTTEIENEQKVIDNSNPFDIKKSKNPNSSEKALPAVTEQPDFDKKTSAPNVPDGKKKSFLFTIIVSMLVILALTVTLLREFIGKSYRAFLNDNLLNQLHREQGYLPRIPYMVLYALFFINTGIFIYLALDNYELLPFGGTWLNLYATTGIVLAIFLFKHMLLRLIGWLFPIKKEVSTYSFTILVFNIIIGLMLIPFNVLLAYGPEGLFTMTFWTATAFIVAVFLFRYLRGLFISGKYLALYKFHFLLYLCAVEIAPVPMILKLILLAQGE